LGVQLSDSLLDVFGDVFELLEPIFVAFEERLSVGLGLPNNDSVHFFDELVRIHVNLWQPDAGSLR